MMHESKKKFLDMLLEAKCRNITAFEAASTQYKEKCVVCHRQIQFYKLEHDLRLVMPNWWGYAGHLVEHSVCSETCLKSLEGIGDLRYNQFKKLVTENAFVEYAIPWHPTQKIRLSLHSDFDTMDLYNNPQSWEKEIREQAYHDVLMKEYKKEHGKRCGHCIRFKDFGCHLNSPTVFQESRLYGKFVSSGEVSGKSFAGFGKVSGNSYSDGSIKTDISYSTQTPEVSPYRHPCKDYIDTRENGDIPSPPERPVFNIEEGVFYN